MNRKSIVNAEGRLVELLVFESNGRLMNYSLSENCYAVPYLNDHRIETNGYIHSPLRPRWDFESDTWLDTASVQETAAAFPVCDFKEQIRTKRNELLTESDFAVLPDSPFTAEQRAAWAIYRQALRDVPQQEGFPFNVIFPEIPE